MHTTFPSAVLFDLYGTLIPAPDPRLRLRRRRELAHRLDCDAEAFVDAYASTKETRLAGRFGSVREALGAIAELAGGRPADTALSEAECELLRWTRSDLSLGPAHSRFLAGLRSSGMRLGLVSDCEAEVATVLFDLPLARYFDAVTLSCTTGVRKPAATQYEHCAVQLGVEVAQCVFIGDGGSRELWGAERAGATPIHFCDDGLNPSMGRGEWPGLWADSLDALSTTIKLCSMGAP
ncbi:HAD family hydrolase [Nocardia implantans]|uniref:HAD family hydrolase n=1 Tax=Nocardia implantans TaxID=3108168 RepID=A0ABU6B0T9_9NOCA|nr:MULTISPECIES: HAD family hydrolase [unclassified Nocardia]MBF6195332.1 HAD family hydrolase [Nocardia beijingensis]MEA3528725.1 HAD family hydrolase [Nocardia sp. CDC192]MEB3513251.1 HAD family hydrolase [Nocardia sp. CDC186]